jgi:DNA-binding NtrC family response regulator
MRSRILFISGHQDDAHNLMRMLHGLPLTLDHVECLQLARGELREADYNVILTEATLPDGNWVDALHLARECPRELDVIVTDSHADDRLWSQVLNFGAYDLIAQPFYQPEVRRILSNACSRRSGERYAVPV